MKKLAILSAALLTGWAAVAGVMAYKEMPMTLVGVRATSGSVAYYLADAVKAHAGDEVASADLGNVYESYSYGDNYGVGANAALTDGTIFSLKPVTAVAVHKRVYDICGFDYRTASELVSEADRVNTKELTYLDKKLYGAYLKAIGSDFDYDLEAEEDDTDHDGIPDGWEMYVGLDPTDFSDARTTSVGTAKITDESLRLTNVQEYLGGTDPASPTTMSDTLLDTYVYRYHLRRPNDDDDGDGLSNYAEYLISEVYQFETLSPDEAKTDGVVSDYFHQLGQFYYGEVFTDHDQVNDEWEDDFQKTYTTGSEYYATRYKYDAHLDEDGDGWSNWAEYGAGTSITDSGSVPMPVIKVALDWNGDDPIDCNFVVQAWSEDWWKLNESAMVVKPEAQWIITNDTKLVRNETYNISIAKDGYVREGKNNFVVFADKNGDGEYTFGEPFGFVNEVDVGYAKTEMSVELLETAPIFARLNIWSAESDQATKWGDNGCVVTNGRPAPQYVNSDYERVRIVRSELNGYGIIDNKYIPNAVVFDKWFNKNARSYIHEGDFLAEGEFDIDWTAMLANNIVADYDKIGLEGFEHGITNVTYRIVIGENSSVDPGDTNNVLSVLFQRRFDATDARQVPQTVEAENAFNGAYPTFRWTMDGNNSYTAFRIVVLDGNDNTKTVYDTGIRRAPITKDGIYTWIGDCAAGKELEYSHYYKWKVSMYNAKFRTDCWSELGTFSMNVNDGFDRVNGYDAHLATVKYAGADVVLTTAGSTVIVEAHERPDCAGKPLAKTVITDLEALTVLTNTEANARLMGIPEGTDCYILAFIDQNGNGERDVFESYGISDVSKFGEVVGVYIEDTDNDQDWMPDAYEYAVAGNTGDWENVRTNINTSIIGDGTIAVSKDLADRLAAVSPTQAAGFGTALTGASIEVFQSEKFVRALMGIGVGFNISDMDSFLELLAESVKAHISE